MITVKTSCGKVVILDSGDDCFGRTLNLNSSGYVRFTEVVSYYPKRVYKTVLLHRKIIKAKVGEIVDHINGNKLDNRRSNLRIVSASTNLHNKHQVLGKSRYQGVSVYSRNPNKYYALFTYQSNKFSLGSFENEKEAAKYVDYIKLCFYPKTKIKLNFESSRNADYLTLTLNRLEELKIQKGNNLKMRLSKEKMYYKFIDLVTEK